MRSGRNRARAWRATLNCRCASVPSLDRRLSAPGAVVGQDADISFRRTAAVLGLEGEVQPVPVRPECQVALEGAPSRGIPGGDLQRLRAGPAASHCGLRGTSGVVEQLRQRRGVGVALRCARQARSRWRAPSASRAPPSVRCAVTRRRRAAALRCSGVHRECGVERVAQLDELGRLAVQLVEKERLSPGSGSVPPQPGPDPGQVRVGTGSGPGSGRVSVHTQVSS